MITEITSFDGNTFAPDYKVGFVKGSEPRMPGGSMEMLERIGAWPVITALRRNPHKLALMIRIRGSDRNALRSQLFRWLDPEDERPKVLGGNNHDGIPMYVMALCEELRVYGNQQTGAAFVATLAVSGDVRWRAVTETSDTWNITASGQTRVINNSGEDDAYPVIGIEPTSGKTGGFDYKRYALVTWRASNQGANYPIRLPALDTATLVSAGKMQADGSDLRVLVDGKEVDRFLVGMNTATTYIWFSANYLEAPKLQLASTIAGSGTVDSIECNDETEMTRLPARGYVRIGNEVFSYAARDLLNKRLTGIERAIWGTSIAAHSAGDIVYWMQHEVMVTYGSHLTGGASPPAAQGAEPVFTLANSSNTSWAFDIFGMSGYPNRPGGWTRWGNLSPAGDGGTYSVTERGFTFGDGVPYTVAGAWIGKSRGNAYGWALYNPCGITNVNWADGKKRAENVADSRFLCHLMYWVRGDSFWTWQATLADPSLPNTWEAWSQAAGPGWEPADYIAFALYFYPSDVEAGTVTVTLNTNETPQVTMGSEISNYRLACTITNQTTGEAMTVTFEMAQNETLEIDTYERTVIYQLDKSNQFQAVRLDSARRAWLRLIPGNNTLHFADTDTTGVKVTTTFKRRFY